jgi:hypothetical protein
MVLNDPNRGGARGERKIHEQNGLAMERDEWTANRNDGARSGD